MVNGSLSLSLYLLKMTVKGRKIQEEFVPLFICLSIPPSVHLTEASWIRF